MVSLLITEIQTMPLYIFFELEKGTNSIDFVMSTPLDKIDIGPVRFDQLVVSLRHVGYLSSSST